MVAHARQTPEQASVARRIFVAVLVVILVPDSLYSASEVVLELQDGRSVAGTIAPGSDSTTIRIRTESGRAVLTSAFDWRSCVRASVDGQLIDIADLKRRVAELAEAPTKLTLQQELDALLNESRQRSADGDQQRPTGAAHDPAAHQRPEWLDVEAYVANWDRDPEADGLIVHVSPRDGAGHLVRTRGTVDLRLIAESAAPTRSRNRFSIIDRWSVRIELADYNLDAAIVRVPFRTRRSRGNLNVRSDALLTARMKSPGHGTFDASFPWLRLRPLSWTRDRIELHTGKRYLPLEHPRFNPARREVQHY